MAQYEEALRLLEDHLDQSDFEPQPLERVERAEETLGVRFPPTYRRFLLELGAGGVGSQEIYGVVDDDVIAIYGLGQGSVYGLATGRAGPDGEAPVVGFTPGLSQPSDDHEVVSPDFGCFFLETVQFDLEDV
jgi:hypothetical protein